MLICVSCAFCHINMKIHSHSTDLNSIKFPVFLKCSYSKLSALTKWNIKGVLSLWNWEKKPMFPFKNSVSKVCVKYRDIFQEEWSHSLCNRTSWGKSMSFLWKMSCFTVKIQNKKLFKHFRGNMGTIAITCECPSQARMLNHL